MKNRFLLYFISSCFMIFLFPHQAIGFIPNRSYYEQHGDIIWEVPVKKKVVALTFDDGPDPFYTPKILDILKTNHAKATFFLIGNRMVKYPKIIQREVDEGHELGNHTFTHTKLNQMSETKFLDQINSTENLIQSYQLSQIKLLRPPGGTLSEHAIYLAKKEHFKIILWSWHQDPKDWSNPGVYKIAHHILANVQNGDIIILHDAGGDRSQTVQALRKILPQLTKKGFHFVTISQLMKANPKYNALFNDDILTRP